MTYFVLGGMSNQLSQSIQLGPLSTNIDWHRAWL